MAPAYKLTYFDIKGIAEPARFLLKYGGIDFEDIRLPQEQWPQLKPTVPFGQLPLLEVKGKKINQSLAIYRYLAKQVKLVGKDDLEDLQIDSITDTIVDLRLKMGQYFFEEDPKVKETKGKILFEETIPYYFERFDKLAKENNGHLVLGRLTWADIVLVAGYETMNFFCNKDLFANYPNLQAVRNNVHSIPAIKEWIAKRPKTDF